MKVIAFGDSLTAGYQSPFEATPYASFLLPLLPSDTELLVAGVNGETTSDMLRRFDRDVLKNHPDYVIILGGTNDLGWGVSPDRIVANLSRMYRGAADARIIPVACAVPSLLGADALIPVRAALNDKIQKEARAIPISYVDLFTATADPDGRLWPGYSSDGLHFNSEGYRKTAEVIYETVFKK